MIVLIPIFLEKEQLFWRSEDAKDLLCTTIKTAMGINEIARVIVCTNEKVVLKSIYHLGIDVFILEGSYEMTPTDTLPSGSFVSMQYIRETLKLDFQELLILSFKNPLISSDFIKQSIEKYRRSDLPILLSGSRPVDHPCQLNVYYKIKDVGCIHIFEDNQYAAIDFIVSLNRFFPGFESCNGLSSIQSKTYSKSEPYIITKPFYFDWTLKALTAKSTVDIYQRTYQSQTVRYQPIEDLDNLPAVLWVYENPQRARLMFSRELFNEQDDNTSDYRLIGTAYDESTNQVSMELYAEPDSTNFHMKSRINLEILSLYTVKSIALDLSNPLCQSDITDMHFDESSGFFSFQTQYNNFSCMLYCLLEISQDDTYDLSESFPAPDALWRKRGTHMQINAKTGKAINGRQDFPDVIETEGSLVILKKEILYSLSRTIASGNLDFIFMPDNISIQINSYFDFLRYQALLKVNQT